MTLQTPSALPEHVSPSEEASAAAASRKSHRVRRLILWLTLGFLATLGLLFAALVLVAVLSGEDTHKASPGEPALMQVPGYTYEDATAADINHVDTRMGVANKLVRDAYPKYARDAFVSWSTHAVFSSSGQVGVLVLVNVNPDYYLVIHAATPDQTATATAQVLAMSMMTNRETVAGQQVAVVTSLDSTPWFGWGRDNVVAVVVAMGSTGTDEAKARDFVAAYLEEANK